MWKVTYNHRNLKLTNTWSRLGSNFLNLRLPTFKTTLKLNISDKKHFSKTISQMKTRCQRRAFDTTHLMRGYCLMLLNVPILLVYILNADMYGFLQQWGMGLRKCPEDGPGCELCVCALIWKMLGSHHTGLLLSAAASSQLQAKGLADMCNLFLSKCVPSAYKCKIACHWSRILVAEK